MNIQVRGSMVPLTKASGGNDLVGNNDAAIVGGELILLGAAQQVTGSTWTTPSGYSLGKRQGLAGATTPITGGCYYKQAVSGDAGAAVTLHSNNTAAMTGVLAALYDADGGTLNAVLDGTPDQTNTNTDGTTFASPAGTVVTANPYSFVAFVVAVGKTGATSVTPPGGTPTITEIGDVHTAGTTCELAVMVQPAIGAIGARTWTVSGTFDTIVIVEVAFTYTPPSIAGLSDDFNDNSLDTAKWTNASSGTATVAETGQQIVMTPAASVAGANYAVLDSAKPYNLLGSNCYVQLVSAMNLGANKDSSFFVYIDANNAVGFILQFSATVMTLKTMQKVAGVTTLAVTIFSAATYDATHRWLRIREASGTTYWDTSADGVSWSNRHNIANPIALGAVQVEMDAGTVASVASPGTMVWDNLNVAPASSNVLAILLAAELVGG